MAFDTRFAWSRLPRGLIGRVFKPGIAQSALAALGDDELLVGVIQGPGYWDPRRFPERALKRRATVLDVFAEMGLVSPAEAERAKAAPLGVSSRPGVARNRAPAFMDLARRQLARDYPADALRGAGLTVMTTLSPSVQTLSERAVTTTLPAASTTNMARASRRRPSMSTP